MNRQTDAKPRLRLPFQPRRGDPGTWSYDHRKGICITLIAYLLFGIVFMWGKIETGRKAGVNAILIDFPEEERPRLTPEQIRMLQAQQYDDFSDVRNLASNDNSQEQLNSRLRDAKGVDADELYRDADNLDGQMRANREAYEEGLRSERNMIEARNNRSADGEQEAHTARVKGRVTVSYAFADPVRNDINLVVPAYRCESGGEVTVNATLDINGRVTSAEIDESLSAADDCMRTTARGAALSSRFNVDSSAPSKHRGVITYTFIPQ